MNLKLGQATKQFWRCCIPCTSESRLMRDGSCGHTFQELGLLGLNQCSKQCQRLSRRQFRCSTAPKRTSWTFRLPSNPYTLARQFLDQLGAIIVMLAWTWFSPLPQEISSLTEVGYQPNSTPVGCGLHQIVQSLNMCSWFILDQKRLIITIWITLEIFPGVPRRPKHLFQWQHLMWLRSRCILCMFLIPSSW